MSIELDLIIDSADESVDMKSGLESMQGVSDAVRRTAEAILSGKTPKRQSHKDSVRTSLKRSFKGSYGHTFSLDIYDEELSKKLSDMGRATFLELMKHFLLESIYQHVEDISPDAQKYIDSLGSTSEEIVKQLRISSLKKIHDVPSKFHYDIKVRYLDERGRKFIIGKFDSNSAMVLHVKESSESHEIMISVTRLNIHTGNGRLQIKGHNETVAFNFGIEYKDVDIEAKKFFSENLNYNNGIPESKWQYLRVIVIPLTLPHGEIVKYIVKGFHRNE